MSEEQLSYRIRTEIGDTAPAKVSVKLDQTYDVLEILSIKLTQKNAYSLYSSSYGVIVGRVLANGGFGIPNSKVSIFIEVDDDETNSNKILYPYTSVTSANNDSVRYNLLPDEPVDECHQNVGTFPNKRLLLDNNIEIEVFDKYWKYTTVTNAAGDYMLFGIPTGSQKVHVDVDLSDIGVLSQRPRDMVYKGYNIDLFESPNKFRQSTNLNSLSQIITQDKGIYVYSFWGDTTETEDTIAITRCDIEIDYEFEPTCVFIGSIITDTGSNAIAKNCTGTKKVGRLEDMVTGEGSIEMIRKTLDEKVEEYQVKGNRVIDGNGVWCYQIPMNLDYVKTDEYGNVVPTDDPDKGIPTRTRVRFRMSLDENPNDATARKRCRYLVPNNPRLDEVAFPLFYETHEVDYEFGTATREESFCDLLWNKVYTVKNYIPRLQKTTKSSKKNHTGIKAVNVYGDNNPFPYNNLTIKLTFTFRIICIIMKIIIIIVTLINVILGLIDLPLCLVKTLLKPISSIPFIGSIFGIFVSFFEMMIIPCIVFGEDFCDDGVNNFSYAPGCWGCAKDKTAESEYQESIAEYATTGEFTQFTTSTDLLITCIENSLLQEHDGSNFVFVNDWINGCLYAPLWFRKITAAKSFLFGLFRKKAKDQWCSSEKTTKAKLYLPCALKRQGDNANKYYSFDSNKNSITPYYVQDGPGCDEDCHDQYVKIQLTKGVIVPKTTMTDATVYYYKPLEYNDSLGEVVLLFATDIVLLGSLNDCDLNGVPQFFKSLDISTYQLPEDILLTDYTYTPEYEDDGETIKDVGVESMTEMAGCDWGNTGGDQCGEPDGGLFYGVGCTKIQLMPKSCINLSRLCEFGVSMDDSKFIHESGVDPDTEDDTEGSENILISDGFVSYDELYDLDGRSMFATLNGNKLRTKLNDSGMYEYDLRYLYPENFDGSLYKSMSDQQSSCSKTARYNYKLEAYSEDYYRFRMGDSPFYYDDDYKFPRYENSFYFYFGLTAGETAIEQFNSQFFASCTNEDDATNQVVYTVQPNDWCSNTCDDWSGYVKLELENIDTPYSVTISSLYNNPIGYYKSKVGDDGIDCDSFEGVTEITYEDIEDEYIYFSMDDNEELDNDGYVRINSYGSDSDSTDMNEDIELFLLNDTYTITIVDANENTTSFEITMSHEYLSFTLEADDFTSDEVSLLATYDTYCNIATIQPECDDENETVTRTIGGVLRLENLYYLNNNILSEDDTNNYLIVLKDDSNSDNFYVEMTLCTLTDDEEQTENDINGKRLTVNKVIIDGNENDCSYGVGNGIFFGNLDCGDNTNTDDDDSSDSDSSYGIVFGLPYYDVSFSVKVTQLCSCDANDTTGNVYTLSEEVSGPQNIRLYINEIEYNLISNFVSGAACDEDGNVTVSGENVYGWLSLSNYSLDNSAYNWDNWVNSEKCYPEYYEDTYEEDGYESAEEEATEYRKSVVKTVKEAFYLCCNYQTLLLTLHSDNTPFTYTIIYKEEETSDFADLDYGNVLSACDNTTSVIYQDGNNIGDIYIPTLSYEGSQYYESSVPSGNNGYLASYYCSDYKDGEDDNERYWKHPYFVKVEDGNGNTVPYDGSYFGVHIIDKTLTLCDLVALAYIDEIPYYLPDNEELRGSFLSQEGFLSIIFYNGIGEWDEIIGDKESPSQSGKTFITTFDEQTFNDKNLNVLTVTCTNSYEYSGLLIPDEDAMPTTRIIYNTDDSECLYPYYNVLTDTQDTCKCVSNLTTCLDEDMLNDIIETGDTSDSEIECGFRTYELIPHQNRDLEIKDENCSISETIYGYMKVDIVKKSSENNSAENNHVLTLKVSGVTDSNEVSYIYLVEYTSENYLINKLGENAIESFDDYDFYVRPCTADNMFSEWASDTTYNVGDYVYYDGDYYQCISSHMSGDDFEEDNFNLLSDDTVSFTLSEGDKYFAIGQLDNGCRTISPVYDFTTPTLNIKINMILSSDEWEENTSYSVGDVVTYDDETYICTTEHTSNDTFDESSFTSLDDISSWDVGEVCEEGSIIKYNGLYYYCKKSINTTVRVFNTTYFTLLDAYTFDFSMSFSDAYYLMYYEYESLSFSYSGTTSLYADIYNILKNCDSIASGEQGDILSYSFDIDDYIEDLKDSAYGNSLSSLSGNISGIVCTVMDVTDLSHVFSGDDGNIKLTFSD